MSRKAKGDRIGAVTQTLGLAESKPHNVSTNISVTEYGVHNQDVIVDLHKHGGANSDELITTFRGTVSSQGTVNIPSGEVETSDILVPGRTVKATLYEPDKQENNVGQSELNADSNRRVGVATVIQDHSSSDNCDSRLVSKSVYRYLSDRPKPIVFTNQRNGMSEVGESYRLEKGNAFSFPANVREVIDAAPGDKVTIKVPDKTTLEDYTEGKKDTKRMIAEMHGAIMEMYNAYLQTNG